MALGGRCGGGPDAALAGLRVAPVLLPTEKKCCPQHKVSMSAGMGGIERDRSAGIGWGDSGGRAACGLVCWGWLAWGSALRRLQQAAREVDVGGVAIVDE